MQESKTDLLKRLNVDVECGLSSSDVEKKQEEFGKNELNSKKKVPLFIKFLLQFKDVLIIILLIAAIVSIIVEPEEWVESLIIFIVIIVNAILGVFQENKAEKSLEALKKMSSPSCKVIRDNALQTINSSDVVVGDIILVEAGDFIPADARIIESSNLQVDESALTGESVAVNKTQEELTKDIQGLGDLKNMIFSSCYVTNGKAKAVVTNIGMNTEIGKIAGMLLSSEETKTPLQHKLASVGKVIGIMALCICVVVFFLEVIASGNGFTQETVLDSFKIAVALAVAAIPEGLATVVTIVLAIGVSQMAKRNAIVKKLPAVETLGSTNVICSDKTGTLTQNKMTVVKIYLNELKDIKNLTKEEKKAISYFALCCDASINRVNNKIERIGDPTELALLDVNYSHGLDITNIKKVFDLPFDSDRKLMTTVILENNKYIAITKGAPDVIISRSINKERLDEALKTNDIMSSEALRVLGLGIKVFDKEPSSEDLENNLEFIGLIGMIDPAREEVKDAITIAHKAGIKTVMITGDHITTACAIAKKLGILGENDKAITSKELDTLSDEYLEEHIKEYSVYARVAPKDKVRIVSAWQKQGAVVAMTGDGVNDAPALKKADIGCAMGITGTDVSKEAADMILTDDNFTTIVAAVKQGRGIYSNIRTCVKYLLSSNIGEVITIFLASLLSLIPTLAFGVPLSPIHLLWINLITDSLPAFGLGMEEASLDVMNEKPRDKSEGFFANGLGYKIVFEGIAIGLLTLISYIIGNSIDHTMGQTMAFLTLSTTQLLHSFNVKSNNTIFSKKTFNNKFLNFAFIIGFVLQLGVIYIPGLNSVFKLQALNIEYFLISIALAFSMVIIMEISKLVTKLINKKKNK